MASQPERIAALEEFKSSHSKLFWSVVAGAILWLSSLSLMMFSVREDVQAIKQKLADGGLGGIVSQLEHPKSGQQLAASLGMIASQIRVDRASGKPPKIESVTKLSSAVEKVTNTDPQLPEVWQAASALVSYRSEARSDNLPNDGPDCLSTVIPGTNVDKVTTSVGQLEVPGFADSKPGTPWVSHVYLGHCVLTLDDQNFDETSVGKFFADVRKHHPNVSSFSLVMTDAKIIYTGGKLIPITEAQFVNCTFVFEPPVSVPPARGRTLTRQLLTANLDKTTVQLPGF